MTFVERVHEIYGRHRPRHIHPFIGRVFRAPADDDLRVMAVGINAYFGGDWTGEDPEVFAGWFADQKYRFQKGALRDVKQLCEAITTRPFLHAGRRFAGIEGVYLTNAVKVYMPVLEGKRADQLGDADFEAHADQWRDELDAMAETGVFPHVIAILGEPFYTWCKGPSLHFANRVTVSGPGGEHDVLLVRLRHPAARSSTGSPAWLLGQDDFRGLVTEPA